MSSTRPVNSGVRQEMFDKFQPWVLSTYGDSAKTKTITLKKAIRIQALLRSGDKNDSGSSSEPSGSDVAKFRLWVKSKGLTLTRPGTEKDPPSVSGVDDDCQEEDTPMLFVPTGTDKNIDGKVQLVYKRVAVVEQFFSIIYNVHVESSSSDTPQLRGRAGKHCGQKRTYRAVADQYAFIPREAISKFLSYCTECQKKQPCITAASLKSPPRLEIKESRQSFDSYPGACAGEVFDSSQVPATPPATPPSDQEKVRSALSPAGSVSSPAEVESGPADPQQLQLEPADHHHQLQGYNQQQQAGGDQPNYHINQQAAAVHAMAYAQACHAMQSFMSRSLPMPLPQHNYQTPEVERMEICGPEPYRPEPEPSGDRGDGGQSDIDLSLPITSTYLRKMRCGGTDMMQFWSTTPQQDEDMDKTEGSTSSLSMMTTSGSMAPAVSSVSPLSPAVSLGSQVKSQSTLSHLLQQQNGNMNMSPSTLREDVSVTDDTSSTGNKDDDDDEDEEDGNDENFDGLNRDPERLKAFNMFVRLFVDENLDRHVPISKQPKEKIQAIIDSCTRQFPEYSERARKRIRTYLKSCRRTKRSREQAGLDINNRPTPPHLTSVLAEQLLARACENEAENAKRMRMGLEPVSQSLPSSLMTSPSMDTMPSPPQLSLTTSAKIDYKSEQLVNLLSAAQNAAAAPPPPPAPAHISLSGSNNSHISGSNGAGLTQSPQFLGVSSVGLLDGMGLANGQNSVEGLKKAPILNHKLNGTEIAAVRQLITGYRESAAFLLRSADELEHLIQIQAKL